MPLPILFLTGPSGTGKSTLCRFAAREHGWLAYDLDQWQTDALALYGLTEVWRHYLTTADSGPLTRLLGQRATEAEARGVVLGFPGGFTPSLTRIRQLQPAVTVLYLSGPPDLCREAFRQRESNGGRQLPDHWWDANNLNLRVQESGERLFDYLQLPAMQPHVLPMFTANGDRRSMTELWHDLIRRVSAI